MNTILDELKKSLPLEGEVLKPIPNFSRYNIDINSGKIFDTKKDRWIKAKSNDIGYVYVGIVNDEGERECHPTHRLVISAATEMGLSFFKKLNLEVDHRDKNRSNNAFVNLKLVTKKQNHENVRRVKGRRLSAQEVLMLKSEFEKEQPKRKIEWYKQKSLELGVCWQTVQYNLLGYSNSRIS